MTRSSSLAMQQYSIEPRTRKYAKGYEFFIIRKKIWKLISGCRTRSCKTAFKEVADKAGQFLGNQTADAITESTVRQKN